MKRKRHEWLSKIWIIRKTFNDTCQEENTNQSCAMVYEVDISEREWYSELCMWKRDI